MASKIIEWYAEEGNPWLVSRYIDKYSTHQPKLSSFLNFIYQTHLFLYYSLSSEDMPFLLFGLVSFLPCLENCTHVSRTYGKRSFRTINISWFRSPSIYIIINAFCLWTSWKASKDFNFTLTIDETFIGQWIEFTGWDDVLAAQPSVGGPNSQIFLSDHRWLMLRIPGRSGKRRKSSEIGFES